MPSTQKGSRHEGLYAQAQRRMVESGEWDRISFLLNQQLNESGWLDNFRHKSKEIARNSESVTVETLIAELHPFAEAAVSEPVKKDILTVIRRWVRFNTTAASPLSITELPPESITEPVYASNVVNGRGVRQPYYHPQTHGIPVASIQFRSYHPELLDLFAHFTSHAAASLAIPISRTVHLPTQRSLWTVPRSPFVHKKSQENFERKVHKRLIKAWDAHHEVVDLWIKYLEEHAMPGVGIRVTKWQSAPVGIGQKTLEAVMNQMRLDSVTRAEKVKALGEQIVQQELAASEAGSSQAPVPQAAEEKASSTGQDNL
ncbi:37S ribosomal protein S10, mitochondrial [Grifola frondosa]|uniref:Transcription and mRNA export factor SUS1 n=1 Tax=Grifola frondosa TaxID=5627 RepID=A0A1C7M8Z6_GRIFR|nr:37S ribosomal protein S10, mitochondrial [Grifola frondosa]